MPDDDHPARCRARGGKPPLAAHPRGFQFSSRPRPELRDDPSAAVPSVRTTFVSIGTKVVLRKVENPMAATWFARAGGEAVGLVGLKSRTQARRAIGDHSCDEKKNRPSGAGSDLDCKRFAVEPVLNGPPLSMNSQAKRPARPSAGPQSTGHPDAPDCGVFEVAARGWQPRGLEDAGTESGWEAG